MCSWKVCCLLRGMFCEVAGTPCSLHSQSSPSPHAPTHAAIKTFSDQHDFVPEAERAAAAVESSEEDLKDLKKANQQVRLPPPL